MFGLAEIRSINADAAARAEDRVRQKRGLKPKDEVGRILRKRSAPVKTVAKARKILLQGRNVEVR